MGNVVTVTVTVVTDQSGNPRPAGYPDESPVQTIEPTSLADGPMLNDPPMAIENLMG
jgi:hypothetical protein